MFYTIYKITNKIDGKIYIGKHQTKDLNDGYMGSGKHLKRAIEKYGIEYFEKEILFQFDNEVEMNAKESEIVNEEFVLREDTYNICVGGQGGFSYINEIILVGDRRLQVNRQNIKLAMTSESRVKAKNKLDNGRRYRLDWSLLSKDVRDAAISKRSKTQTGSKRSEDTRRIMSESSTGSKNSQFGTMWITNGIENKKIKKDIDLIPEGWYKGRI